jgi:hypothetical protein
MIVAAFHPKEETKRQTSIVAGMEVMEPVDPNMHESGIIIDPAKKQKMDDFLQGLGIRARLVKKYVVVLAINGIVEVDEIKPLSCELLMSLRDHKKGKMGPAHAHLLWESFNKPKLTRGMSKKTIENRSRRKTGQNLAELMGGAPTQENRNNAGETTITTVAAITTTTTTTAQENKNEAGEAGPQLPEGFGSGAGPSASLEQENKDDAGPAALFTPVTVLSGDALLAVTPGEEALQGGRKPTLSGPPYD